MMAKDGLRPGGRSARVQASVHQAVRRLTARLGRPGVTIPMVAAEAGVTPSTIYRRWGDLAGLLADVAVERMQPDTMPVDTGGLVTDLDLWFEQYAEEMSSGPGRDMLKDILAAGPEPDRMARCCGYTTTQLDHILDRAAARGEAVPAAAALIDDVVAPILYRILFGGGPVDAAFCSARIRLALARDGQPQRQHRTP
ncbi:TetR/AcrR family transcriptional regulator [Tistrella bauzanensis]|nr:TetR/AcrR family transcriptional regulator [Tistrella bauzanensis]